MDASKKINYLVASCEVSLGASLFLAYVLAINREVFHAK